MIVFLTILSLVSGLVYGYFDVESSFISAITQNTHIVLYILMFSVGISIGMYDGIVQKIREYHIKIFIIPIGIIIGSLLGGIICSMIVKNACWSWDGDRERIRLVQSFRSNDQQAGKRRSRKYRFFE